MKKKVLEGYVAAVPGDWGLVKDLAVSDETDIDVCTELGQFEGKYVQVIIKEIQRRKKQ